MNHTILAITVVSLFSHASLLSAQEVDETMVITANRVEQGLEQVIAPISVVTRQEIEAYQAKSLTDVLRRLPGVEVTSNGGFGQTSSVFIRGASSNQTLVLVDGIRFNNSITAGINFNRIPLAQVERIEVVRGGASAAYGSDAIGGVINIITQARAGEEGTQLNIGAGSRGYKEGNAVVNTAVGDNGQLKLAVGFQQDDGYNVNPVAGENDGDKHGFDNQQFMVNYEHSFNQRWSALGSLRWFDSTAQYNNCDFDYTTFLCNYYVADGRSETTSYSAKVQYKGDQLRSYLTLNYQTEQLEDTIQGNRVISKLDIEQTNVQWVNDLALTEEVSTVAGIDWRKERLGDDAISWGGPDSAAGEERNSFGAYISPTYTKGDFVVQAAGRYDRHDTYDDYTTWMVGSAYRINEIYRVSARYNTSFKAPSFKDLASNPDLKPEEARSAEIGLEAVYDLAYINLTAYQSEIDNLQLWYVDNTHPSGGYLANVDADIKGIELELGFATGLVNHSVIAELKDHKDTQGEHLARRARENYKWISDIELGQWQLSSSYIFTGSRPDLPVNSATTPEVTLPSYSLWDLAVTYWVTNELKVSGRVDNVLDKQYETSGGYPAPERAYYFNASYQF
ncbi:TonB-dependent receptor domain-containing protein [Vibrio sp. WXL103]|uniref:TonB-dependent receptor domain-containing protein n=1 Tax=unclassified Vibrio TaxID=2614977 RepID=UPI003EC7C027